MRSKAAAQINIFSGESRIRRIRRTRQVKKALNGESRRTSAPWYGFRADLAIAAQWGIATASIRG
jgi:hypothetical protein